MARSTASGSGSRYRSAHTPAASACAALVAAAVVLNLCVRDVYRVNAALD